MVGGPTGPDLSKLSFVARAITPPYSGPAGSTPASSWPTLRPVACTTSRPRAAKNCCITRWFSLDEAEQFDLPSITRSAPAAPAAPGPPAGGRS